MKGRLISLLIGYVIGSFLTAEAVARKYARKSAADLGETGNPGMANIMASLGFVPGILTLAGDLGKVIAAALISWLLSGKRDGSSHCMQERDAPSGMTFRSGDASGAERASPPLPWRLLFIIFRLAFLPI